MYDYPEIYSFLARELGVDPSRLNPDISLLDDLGVDGDDFSEFTDAFARTFKVDMSTYRWYFHHGEEGINLGSLFFSPPYNRVEPIPVTPKLLLESANAGMWILAYPVHELPHQRYDILFNWAVVVISVLLMLVGVVRKMTG